MRQPRSSLLKLLLSSLILMLMVGDVAAQRGMGGGFRPSFYSNQQFARQNQSYNYQAQRQQQALYARQQRDYAIQQQATMRQQRQFMEQRRQDMQRAMQQRQEQAALQRKIISDRQQQAQGSKIALLSQQKASGRQIAAQFALKEQRQLKDRQERLLRLKQVNRKNQQTKKNTVETRHLISIATLAKNFKPSTAVNDKILSATDTLKGNKVRIQALTNKLSSKKQRVSSTKSSSSSCYNHPCGNKNQKKYWQESKIFDGSKVYIRNDLINPMLIDNQGRSNIERMKSGRAPIGPDGESINLHHLNQSNRGSLAEVKGNFHKKYHRIIHINSNKTASGIDRKDFSAYRTRYWKNRAKDFEGVNHGD